jgi:ribose transport system substrate-binding protein
MHSCFYVRISSLRRGSLQRQAEEGTVGEYMAFILFFPTMVAGPIKRYQDFLPNGGGVLHIQGPSENFAAKDRTTGMQMTLPPSIPVITLRGQWTEDSAQRSVESWLRLNTSQKMVISAVGAQNDAMAMGARKAFSGMDNLSERDRWLRLPYVGCDGVPKTGQTWVRTGTLAATVVIPPTGGRALTIMHQALQTGVKPPERSFATPESFPPVEQLGTR